MQNSCNASAPKAVVYQSVVPAGENRYIESDAMMHNADPKDIFI